MSVTVTHSRNVQAMVLSVCAVNSLCSYRSVQSAGCVVNGMQSLYSVGHIKDPVPLIAKRRGLSPGDRFPPSFIHQVIIITGLNKLYNCMFSP